MKSFRQSLDENRGWAWKLKIAAVQARSNNNLTKSLSQIKQFQQKYDENQNEYKKIKNATKDEKVINILNKLESDKK